MQEEAAQWMAGSVDHGEWVSALERIPRKLMNRDDAVRALEKAGFNILRSTGDPFHIAGGIVKEPQHGVHVWTFNITRSGNQFVVTFGGRKEHYSDNLAGAVDLVIRESHL